MTLRPRHSTYRGSVEAVGVIVTSSIIGEPEARRRIIDLWTPGTSVFGLAHDAWLVRWPEARRLRCDRAPGLPVALHGLVLATAPLTDKELAALAPLPGSLVRVQHGACDVVSLDRELDITTWLDVSAFEPIAVTSLGDPVPCAALPSAPAPAVRALFGELVGAAPAEARDVAAALYATARRSSIPADSPAVAGPSRRAPWIAGAALAGVVAVLAAPVAAFSALAAAFVVTTLAVTAAVARRFNATGSPPPRSITSASPPAASQPRLRPRSRLRDALTRFLAGTGLLRALGHRQSQYLQRMIAMFERGDFHEALRHAIPLGGRAGHEPGPPPLSSPTARGDLKISLATIPAATSLTVDTGGFALLRKIYRDAFDRLVRERRIDEAAFVLAELLQADEEAVAFLERHGRARLAAEIAEARNLAPALVVRQWFLAGDRQRAVAIARRSGAFADAVARLERDPGRSDEAAALRMIWADILATSGDYGAAVEIIAPVPGTGSLARTWLDHAIAGGGCVGALALGRKLQRFPEALLAHHDLLAMLTDPEDPAQASARATLMTSLGSAPANPAVRAAIRPLLRALIADGARGEPITEANIRKLGDLLGDDPLRIDLPAWPTPSVSTLLLLKNVRTSPIKIDLSAADCGAIAVHDVALLPDGKLLVALGELGVRLLARDGRTLWHADQPATSLVLSDHGDRAIAVTRRGDAFRLARLDLARRTADSWCEAQLDCWADDFDGQTWLVGQGSRLLVIDVLADPTLELRVLDHRDLGSDERMIQIARSPTSCIAIAADWSAGERWRWELPAWILRRRGETPQPGRDPPGAPAGQTFISTCGAQSAQGEYVGCHVPVASGEPSGPMTVVGPEVLSVFREDQPHAATREVPGHAKRVAVAGPWIALATLVDTGLEVHLIDLAELRTRLVVALTGAAVVALRFGADTLTLADDRGRVLTVELRHGGIERKLRML